MDGELDLRRPGLTRRRLGTPEPRRFAGKIELAWQMTLRLKAEGLPFDLVARDDLYDSHRWFGFALIRAQILCMADLLSNTPEFLWPPIGMALLAAWFIARTKWE